MSTRACLLQNPLRKLTLTEGLSELACDMNRMFNSGGISNPKILESLTESGACRALQVPNKAVERPDHVRARFMQQTKFLVCVALVNRSAVAYLCQTQKNYLHHQNCAMP